MGTAAQHQLLPEWRSGLQLPGPGRHDSVAEPEVFASANDYKRLRPAPASCRGVMGHTFGLAAWGWTSGQAARCFLGFSGCSSCSVRICNAAAGFPSGRFP